MMKRKRRVCPQGFQGLSRVCPPRVKEKMQRLSLKGSDSDWVGALNVAGSVPILGIAGSVPKAFMGAESLGRRKAVRKEVRIMV